jgi:hypothetical protein
MVKSAQDGVRTGEAMTATTKHRSPIIAPAWVIPGVITAVKVFGTHNAFYA